MVAWALAGLLGCSPSRLISAPPVTARPPEVATTWTSPQARELALQAQLAVLSNQDPHPYLQRMALYDGSVAALEAAFLIEVQVALRDARGGDLERVSELLAQGERFSESVNPDVQEARYALKRVAGAPDAERALVAALELEQDALAFELRFTRLCGQSVQALCVRLAGQARVDPVAQAVGEFWGEEQRRQFLWARLVLEGAERSYPLSPFAPEPGWFEAALVRPRTAWQALEAMHNRNPSDKAVLQAWDWLKSHLPANHVATPHTMEGQKAVAAGDKERARAEFRQALSASPELPAAIFLAQLGDPQGDARWILPAWERWPEDPTLTELTQQLFQRSVRPSPG